MQLLRPSGRVIVAGGTGFLGQALLTELLKEYEQAIVLTRASERVEGNVRYVHWDGASSGEWCKWVDGADAIVNLVGRSVDCRKTPENRKEILESRVNSVVALAAACRQAVSPPRTWIQSATAHIYGDTWDEIIDETSPIGTGFAPMVGTAWEKALNDADLPNIRKVILRISFVLGRDGGALKTLARLARLGLGGTVGSGRQYISWIHVDDLSALILRALSDESMSGVCIATAPNPVTNAEFMRHLRRAVHRPWSPPAPGFAVRVAARLMNTDPELALLGRRIVPSRLMKDGFVFQHPDLPAALEHLLNHSSLRG